MSRQRNALRAYLADSWDSQPVETLWRQLTPSAQGSLLMQVSEWSMRTQGTPLHSFADALHDSLLKLFAKES